VRRSSRAFALMSVFSLALTACGGVQQSTEPGGSGVAASPGGAPAGACEPVSTETPEAGTGGTVRVGIGGSADSLNPGLAVLAEAFELFELVYDTPLSITADGQYEPELATEWSVADDGVTWTITFRDDVTFHDGTPMTAEDVKFSLELYRDNVDFPYQSSYPDVFETITVEDPTTLTIVTSEPVGNMEYRLLFMYVLPMHIWESEDPLTFENAEMIGTGPFALTEFVQGESAQLAAYEDYYGGRPIVDEVIYQTIENSDARVTALTNGEIDLLFEFPVTAIPQLRSAENVQVCVTDQAAGGDLTDIIFNVVSDEDCPPDDPETPEADAGVCSGHPALKEVEVRQALAMATDKEELIVVSEGGLATPGIGLVPIGLGDFFASELTDYEFAPQAAAGLLEEAGYVDEDGDGIRECKADQDCEDLTFRFNYPTDSDTAPREAEIIAGQWREAGVNLEIQGLDPDTLTSVCCPAFDYDVILWGWGSDPDPQFLSGVLLCSEITTGFSESGYCNPEYDELYDQQAVETDPDARVDLIHEMQRIALEDVPYIIPYYSALYQAWRTDTFTGWSFDDPSLSQTDPSVLRQVAPIGAGN
jgi:peptide/nickel transport system substrate-binding protein